MTLSAFDANYGNINFPREFWGGDNGWVTVVLDLPAGVELGTTTSTATDPNVLATAQQAAAKNLWRVTNAIGSRGTIVAYSTIATAVDPTVAGFGLVDGTQVIAYGTAGTLAAGAVAITFMVERATVFNSYGNKPGSSVSIAVTPATDIANSLVKAGLFLTPAGVAATAAGVAVKVRQNFPAIL